MDLEKANNLFIELEAYLKEYGNNSILNSYRIVKSTVHILTSNEDDESKEKVVIENYKKLFFNKGGLSEFYVWDNDFETRKKINMPLKEICNELWGLVKDCI